MSENIFKIWGQRRRILLTDKTEIDLLYLKKNTFCSLHKHTYKANKFVCIEGHVRIETEFGTKYLKKNESFTVPTPTMHRFFALEDSTMIELAFVTKGTIDPKDINRILQGGRSIEGRGNVSEDCLRKEGLLDLQ